MIKMKLGNTIATIYKADYLYYADVGSHVRLISDHSLQALLRVFRNIGYKEMCSSVPDKIKQMEERFARRKNHV